MTTVTFKMSPEDEARLAAELWLLSGAVGASRKQYRAALRPNVAPLLLASAVLVAGGVRFLLLSEQWLGALSLWMGAALIWSVVRSYGHRHFARFVHKSFMGRARFDTEWTLVTPRSISVSEVGVRRWTPTLHTVARWSMVDEVVRADAGVSLVLRGANQIVIPSRAFAGEAAVRDFVAAAESFRTAAKARSPRALAEFLKGRTVHCMECRYDLRGCQSDRCPECGVELDLLELQWHQVIHES